MKLWIHLLKKVDNVVLVNHFFCPPFPQAMLSLPKMTWMPDINIVSGGGGGRKCVISTGLLPSCPKNSGQDCSLVTKYFSVWPPRLMLLGLIWDNLKANQHSIKNLKHFFRSLVWWAMFCSFGQSRIKHVSCGHAYHACSAACISCLSLMVFGRQTFPVFSGL